MQHYQTLAHYSQRMHQAALLSDWDTVAELEQVCHATSQNLQALNPQEVAGTLTPTQRATRQRLLLSILRHDAQVRALAEPWLADVGEMLDPGHPWKPW